ncbi:MAG: dodecin family protein [Rhodanobacteraceae bacterium]
MSVTKVIELSASSPKGIEDAARRGLEKAGKTVKNIRGAWVNDIKITTDPSGAVQEWRVNMRISFEVD